MYTSLNITKLVKIQKFFRGSKAGSNINFQKSLKNFWAATHTLLSFCKQEHLKIFPFVKIDIFILRQCSRSGKICHVSNFLVCELSIISINNFAKGNILILTIMSQQLFFTIGNLKILYAAVIVADNAIFND